jgi:hypothetical protein
LLACLIMSSVAMSQTEQEYAAARDEVWAKEQAIYKARSNGDLSYYLANASANYKGWPPYLPEPGGVPYLKDMTTDMVGQDQEELTMELAEFALSGDTGVIYYHTHRTRMPNGDPVDQRYAICHVWTRENEVWKLIGAMGREKPAATQE